MSEEETKSKKIHVFAWDPGDKRNGFCYFQTEKGSGKADIKIKKIMSPEEMDSMLKVLWGLCEDPKNTCVFVCENFRVDSHVRGAMFQWNEMETSQAIGKIKLVATWTNSQVVMQEPSKVLGNARRWSPIKLPKGHIKDDDSAMLHGISFLMDRNMIMVPKRDITLFGQEMIG